MPEIPNGDEFVSLSEAAKRVGVTVKRVRHAAGKGLIARTGEAVKLQTWRTLGGLCTTMAAINEFNRKLNCNRKDAPLNE